MTSCSIVLMVLFRRTESHVVEYLSEVGVNSRAPEREAVSPPHVALVVLPL
jgi:hypothetical protein